MATAMLYLPKAIRTGDIITLKAILSHPMETGYRRDSHGAVIPRDVVRRLSCTYDGEEIFAMTLFPAISANPFVAFTTIATRSGPVTFTWEGDKGFRHSETAILTVSET